MNAFLLPLLWLVDLSLPIRCQVGVTAWLSGCCGGRGDAYEQIDDSGGTRAGSPPTGVGNMMV